MVSNRSLESNILKSFKLDFLNGILTTRLDSQFVKAAIIFSLVATLSINFTGIRIEIRERSTLLLPKSRFLSYS